MGKIWDTITRGNAHKDEPAQPAEVAPQKREGIMSGNFPISDREPFDIHARLEDFARIAPVPQGVAMDSSDMRENREAYRRGQPTISDELAAWYSSQSFIGHQLCALMMQHWLIMKCCAQPARDAIRNGFTITSTKGEIPPEQLQVLERANKRFGLKRNMLEFLTFGRGFGIRIAIFDVNYDNPDVAYEAPFNIDGVSPKSYRGISQVDPYWCAPELSAVASGDPTSQHFYEPTHWRINGRKYHRSHLIIYRHGYLPDILKPAYQYGGIPVPQLIMERVYGAERTANEAPLLAMTKRTVVYKTDLSKAVTNYDKLHERVAKASAFWTNTGARVIDTDDVHEQHDTALADLDVTIMTQFQLVAAAAEVPATKLLATQPKGFNATGEFDESSYHETLESIQEHDLTRFVERHLQLVAKSMEIDLQLEVTWNPLDTPTEKEQADTNLVKAQAGAALIAGGVIDATDERSRLLRDKNSGYAGVIADPDEADATI